MRSFTVTLGALALLAAGAPAGAADTKTYPAFLCEESGGAPSGGVNRSEYRVTKSGGAAGTFATVICPIVRDSFVYHLSGSTKNSAGVAEVTVDVADAIFDADVACTFIARANNTSLFYQTRQTSGVSSDVQTLAFDVAGTAFGDGNYIYAISCVLPTNIPPQVAKIFSYRVTEL